MTFNDKFIYNIIDLVVYIYQGYVLKYNIRYIIKLQ